MVGDIGKAYAADIMFHHILDGLDPLEVIEQPEKFKMYLEDAPCHAVREDLYDYGTMTHNGQEYPMALMFRNEADIGIDIGGCDNSHSWENRFRKDLIIATTLNKRFSMATNGNVGGMIFASSLSSECATVEAYVRERDSMWDCHHQITVNSQMITRTAQFQGGWDKMIAQYGC